MLEVFTGRRNAEKQKCFDSCYVDLILSRMVAPSEKCALLNSYDQRFLLLTISFLFPLAVFNDVNLCEQNGWRYVTGRRPRGANRYDDYTQVANDEERQPALPQTNNDDHLLPM